MRARDIAARAEADPAFAARLKADPIEALRDLPEPLRTDVWVYRGIVIALGLVAAGGLLLAAIIALSDEEVPDIFTAAISAAIGAMAGLLVPSPREES